MSFYRSLVAAVAAMGLATCAFADENAATASPAADASSAQVQPAQAQPMQTADSTATTTTTTTTDVATDKVDLNKATAKDLKKAGMTAAQARAVVSYRKKNGDFKSVDDLKMVKGFKKMKPEAMQKLTDKLTVG